MDDAEKALAIAPYSTKARIAKAEALYSMGQFEKVDKISILFSLKKLIILGFSGIWKGVENKTRSGDKNWYC